MQTYVRSVSWAFIKNGINIYVSENCSTSFNAVGLRCERCYHPWYDQMDECFLCRELRYHVAICPLCRREFSDTGRKTCNQCREEPKLKNLCINHNCPTVTNETPFQTPHRGTRHENEVHNIKEMADYHVEGVFGIKTSFSLALIHCTHCGNTSNNYKSVKVFPYLQNDVNLTEFISNNKIKPGNMIFFIQEINGERQYGFSIYDGIIPIPEFRYIGEQGISEIIQHIFWEN
jgi:hypothetical protein